MKNKSAGLLRKRIIKLEKRVANLEKNIPIQEAIPVKPQKIGCTRLWHRYLTA